MTPAHQDPNYVHPVVPNLLGPDGRPISSASYRTSRGQYDAPTSIDGVRTFVEERKNEALDLITEFEFGVDAMFKVAAMELAIKYTASDQRPSLRKVFGANGVQGAKEELLAVHKALYGTPGGPYDPLKAYINRDALASAPASIQHVLGQHLAYGDGLIQLIEESTDFGAGMKSYFDQRSEPMKQRASLYMKHLKEIVETEAEANRELWTKWILDEHKTALRGLPWKFLALEDMIPQLAVKELFGELTDAELQQLAIARGEERNRPDAIRLDSYDPHTIEQIMEEIREGRHMERQHDRQEQQAANAARQAERARGRQH